MISFDPSSPTSTPSFAMEECEKATMRKIRTLVDPFFPDKSNDIKDPFGEAINLAKALTKESREDALLYIISYFPTTSSDRAYQTLDLIETEKNRKNGMQMIQSAQFRALLKQKAFAPAREMLIQLPVEKLYYYWLYVVECLECVQLDKTLNCIKDIDLLEETFDFIKGIPETFHYFPDMSDMLQKISDKFLEIGHLEKALLAAHMIHNKKMHDEQLLKIGNGYLR